MSPTKSSPSILRYLRSLVPMRDCSYEEALVVAEQQAARLVDCLGRLDPDADGVDLHHIQSFPRMRVVFEPLPVSGMSHWNGQDWIITIATGDSPVRQRFTLLHEFKHIVDHSYSHRLYRGDRLNSAVQQGERAADYFAGCALVPRTTLKRAWGNGLQRLGQLADYFGVSVAAITVRLAQTGLDRETDRETFERCDRPINTPQGQAQHFVVARSGHTRGRCA